MRRGQQNKLKRRFGVIPRKRIIHGKVYWVVWLGKRLTGNKRKAHYFSNRKSAVRFINRTQTDREQRGQDAFCISTKLRLEAADCSRRLEAVGASLTMAADFYLERAPIPGKDQKFDLACDAFIESRRAKKRRSRTIVQYESYRRITSEEFGKLAVREILREDLEDWVEEHPGWEARTQRNYIKFFCTLFNFVVKKGWRSDNPAKLIELPNEEERPPGFLHPDQAAELLRQAYWRARDLLPAIVTGLFGGPRRSELCQLLCSEMDVETRQIEIKGIKAKTRQRRIITINDLLLEWLAFTGFPDSEHLTIKPSPDWFGEQLHELAVAAKIVPWPRNGLRHTFGTFHYAKYRNENSIASEMGNTPDVVFKNYRALVKEPLVSQFWDLTPAKVLGPEVVFDQNPGDPTKLPATLPA